MKRPFHRRALGGAAATLVLALFAGCNQTPTEITALPRALGEVEAVYLSVTNLQPLGENQGTYVAWALLERNEARRLDAFFIDPATGGIVDGNGVPIESFRATDFDLRTARGVLVTIEVDPNAQTPAGTQMLSGTVLERVVDLTVPISSSVVSASGTLRIFTPTDGPNTNENAGFWMQDDSGAPSLSIPVTTAALHYETFIEVDGQNLSVGRFDNIFEADDLCRFCADFAEFDQPERPGDDLLIGAPEGLVFPRDLSGATVRISLEGRFNDFVQQSQLVVLEAVLPMGLTGGETVGFVNVADDFPTGRAVLY